jgi:Mor family transcriptional regulator
MNTDADAAVSFRYLLVRCIRNSLGLPEDVATPMAEHVAREFGRQAGGLYIPKSEIREDRNAKIRREYRPDKKNEVLRRYGISQATLYRILNSR